MVTRAILVVFLAIAATVSALSQELAPRTFFDGQLTLLMPVGFEPMSEEMLSFKYPNERRPTLVFTNPSGSVNVALNHTQNRVLNDQLPELHQALDQMFRQLFPSAEWNRSETGQRNGMRYSTLDLITPAIDTEIRNIMMAVSLDDRMLLVSFNCVRELEAQWAPLGQQIIDSISVSQR